MDSDVGSLYHNIAEGESRPLKGMEREVLRLQLVDNVNPITTHERDSVTEGHMRFKSVDNKTHYLIVFSGDDLQIITNKVIPEVRTELEWRAKATAARAAEAAAARAAAAEATAAEIKVRDMVTIKSDSTAIMYKVMKVSKDENGNMSCDILKDGRLQSIPVNELERFYTTT